MPKYSTKEQWHYLDTDLNLNMGSPNHRFAPAATMAGDLSKTPYAEPLWSTRGQSAYFTEKHEAFRKEVRAYVDRYISPHCQEWEDKGVIPQEVSILTLSQPLLFP